MSDPEHQPSRTRVPMPMAALSDPHMSDAAKNPARAEKIMTRGAFSAVRQWTRYGFWRAQTLKTEIFRC